MTRLAVIGAGLIGREHCGLIKRSEEASLAAIADMSPQAESFARERNAPYFADYAEMLDQIRPDGAIVAVPTALHTPVGLACLERKIPCLVEKPVAESIAAAQQLAKASAAAGIPILVGHHRRHSPDIRTARQVVHEGQLGEVVAVNGMWLADKPDSYFDAAWRRGAGGGPVLINLIHDIDCLRFMVGEIAEVRAFTSSTARGFEVEDTVSLSLRFENGALGSFILSDAVASPYTWEMTSGQALYFPRQPGDCYVIGGRAGTLAVPSMTLWKHPEAQQHWQDPFVPRALDLDGSQPYRNQLDHFVRVIRGDEEPLVTAADATVTLAVVQAIQLAAAEDRTVRVRDLIDTAS